MRRLFILLSVFFVAKAFGQEDDRKNTIYLNFTNRLIFNDAYIIGYERVLKPHRTFSVNIGTISLPRFTDKSTNDSVQLLGGSGNKGFHLSADYRFYLSKENKYEAPRGVYLGPFYAYNYAQRANQWNLNTSTFNGGVNTKMSLSIHTVGLQFGYQFVLWERLALDFALLGPGIGIYDIKASINTSLSEEQKQLFYEKLNSFLEEKIPGYDRVIDEGEFNNNGSTNTTSFGYRYMINLGYRF
jgi:hypothetical protein